MSTDPIANMLTIVKNGYLAQKQNVEVPASKVKFEIARVLADIKLITSVKQKDNKLQIELAYVARKPKIREIRRISKPGLRVYQNINDLKKTNRKPGYFIVSTSKGIVTASQAIAKNLGGEVICQISK